MIGTDLTVVEIDEAMACPLGSLDALCGGWHLVQVDVGWLDVLLTVVDGL